MANLQIWAPRVQAMEIELQGTRLPLEHTFGGWMRRDEPRLAHGVDYTLWLDGEGPFPDPRSAFQPKGFDGPSRYVDHARFAWDDADWQPVPWAQAVVYELHVGTFAPGGTFAAVIERLDHLVDLGVTHVELMPVAEFPGARGWGYDGVHPYAPHHRYGGPDGLKRLVAACHQRGLAVVLDVVYNHLGPRGNHLERFGPYFTDTYHTPWGKAVNVDGPGSDEVRRFFIDNAVMWLRDYHIDGLRLDATDTIVDNSALSFLEQLTASVRTLGEALGRTFLVTAESSLNDPRLVQPVAQGGRGLDALWNEDFHHALHTLLTREQGGYYADYGSLGDLAQVLGAGFCYANRYSRYRGHHYGRPSAGLAGTQLVACLQNHDQVGNRPGGERIGHLVDADRLRLGAALTLLGPCVPLLFQGEEWNAGSPFLYFTDFADAALGAAVLEGRRQQGITLGLDACKVGDPQSESAWRHSQLQWRELTERGHGGILDWYRALIRLRRDHGLDAAGVLDPGQVACSEAGRWLRLRRGNLLVLCNFSARPHTVPTGSEGQFRPLLVSPFVELSVPDRHVVLPPWGVAVLAVDTGEDGKALHDPTQGE